MEIPLCSMVLVWVTSLSGSLRAQEPVGAQSRVESAGLFKNGLAVIRRSVTVEHDGVFELSDVPEPVHGTFWIESTARVEARVTSREERVPFGAGTDADLQRQLGGKQVVIGFADPERLPVEGLVVDFDEAERGWDRSFENFQNRYVWWNRPLAQPSRSAPGHFLILSTQEGTLFVDAAGIATLLVKGEQGGQRVRRPVLELRVSGTQGNETAVAISYLAKGIAWAPSYRVDLGADERLTLTQVAVVRNELEDFEDVEIQLITGYPSIEFSHVLSPMASQTTWASFFDALQQEVGPGSPSSSNVISQQAVLSTRTASSPVDTSLLMQGEGADVHYQSIGRRTLKEGDSLSLQVADGAAAYEPIVEWSIPDTRDADGRFLDDWSRQQSSEDFDDSAWEAVRFENPLPFPMTTGPALVSAGGRFQGQQTSFWAAPGERTTLRITKALSIRTRHVEQEVGGEREVISYGGRSYRKVQVAGEIDVANRRSQGVRLVVRRQFSGDLIAADGEPEQILREEGVYSVNERRELTWTLDLGAGEQRALKYKYWVLVRH